MCNLWNYTVCHKHAIYSPEYMFTVMSGGICACKVQSYAARLEDCSHLRSQGHTRGHRVKLGLGGWVYIQVTLLPTFVTFLSADKYKVLQPKLVSVQCKWTTYKLSCFNITGI